MLPTLPPELISYIISLTLDDCRPHSNLLPRRCGLLTRRYSLVSPIWRTLAQKRLVEVVRLGPRQVAGFRKMLEKDLREGGELSNLCRLMDVRAYYNEVDGEIEDVGEVLLLCERIEELWYEGCQLPVLKSHLKKLHLFNLDHLAGTICIPTPLNDNSVYPQLIQLSISSDFLRLLDPTLLPKMTTLSISMKPLSQEDRISFSRLAPQLERLQVTTNDNNPASTFPNDLLFECTSLKHLLLLSPEILGAQLESLPPSLISVRYTDVLRTLQLMAVYYLLKRLPEAGIGMLTLSYLNDPYQEQLRFKILSECAWRNITLNRVPHKDLSAKWEDNLLMMVHETRQ